MNNGILPIVAKCDTDLLPSFLVRVLDTLKPRQILEVDGTLELPDSPVVTADVVIFHPGSSLKLGKPSDDSVGLIVKKLVFKSGTGMCRFIIPRLPAEAGTAGVPGKSGTASSIHGKEGGHGEAGSPGGAAQTPPAPPHSFVWADEVEFETAPDGTSPPLIIEADGLPGGRGGPGGKGGDGGKGGPGRAGIAVLYGDYGGPPE